jgi:kumamolisin
LEVVTDRFVIPGSNAVNEGDGDWLPVEAGLRISPTIIIRRPPRAGKLSQELLSGSSRPLERAQAEDLLTADPADLAAVQVFAQDYGLTMIAVNAQARSVRVEGSAQQIGAAFGIQIEWRLEPGGQKYLSYRGPLTVPGELAGIVEAVLGLDQRPIARRGAGR